MPSLRSQIGNSSGHPQTETPNETGIPFQFPNTGSSLSFLPVRDITLLPSINTDEMSDRLLPPFMPDDFKSFHAHISSEPEEWLKYFQAIYNYAEKADAQIAELRSALTTESAKLQDQTTAHEADQKALLTTQARLGVLKEQLKEQRQEAQDQISKARQNERRALDMVQARTPRAASAPEPPVRDPALGTGEDPLFTETTSSSHRSERLPDPDKFDGNRQDLRRFVSQIHQKMTTNHDRFPTAQARMAYVNNHYQEVLKVLDRAYGEPDQMNRACTKLFRLRQGNKDFATFFSEFQRLALVGKVSEATLPTLLEQNISKELRAMLLHHDPPSYEYHQFANFLQTLESRMNRFGFINPFNTAARPPANQNRTSATHNSTSAPETRTPAPQAPAPGNTVPRGMTPTPDPDAMDLSHQRRTDRREKGECYRCGSKNHLVAQCPRPDTRQLRSAALPSSRPTPPPPTPRSSHRRRDSFAIEKWSPPGISRPQGEPSTATFDKVIRISTAAVHGLPIEEEYNQRSDLMILPAELSLQDRSFPTYALTDCGAEGKAFIDATWVALHRIPTHPLRSPFGIEVFDGRETEAGKCTHYVRARLRINDHCQKNVLFFVTQLAHYPIVLGMPWLKQHDPTVRFADHSITFDSEYCRNHCNVPGKPEKLRAIHNVPHKDRPSNLPPRPLGLRNLNIVPITKEGAIAYSRRASCRLFVATLEEIDYILNCPDSSLREYLDLFCTAYLDDILIYSRTREEHTEHICAVLKRLRATGLYAQARKCEFYCTETKFLGLIIGRDGIPECNYEIYDKELLAIIRCFEEWRPKLEGAPSPVKVITNHQNLEYFMSTKQLNRRQARWSEFLSRFNFHIVYRPDSEIRMVLAGNGLPGVPQAETKGDKLNTKAPESTKAAAKAKRPEKAAQEATQKTWAQKAATQSGGKVVDVRPTPMEKPERSRKPPKGNRLLVRLFPGSKSRDVNAGVLKNKVNASLFGGKEIVKLAKATQTGFALTMVQVPGAIEKGALEIMRNYLDASTIEKETIWEKYIVRNVPRNVHDVSENGSEVRRTTLEDV
ncbi:Retrotransposon-derived protein PEG10 [Ceratocystis fimbriata CBS 114723]|uniref:RNA-directed DNA polymerase n=1 Tax=Ceratocystis fimbriata CBS 114723 TaxID=1035309 RepID=A0A2C5WVS8_9PEZI|nr:Retrotransposon-derived protein PEG10 [Ceratocystis fimbriata CBS 114723]